MPSSRSAQRSQTVAPYGVPVALPESPAPLAWREVLGRADRARGGLPVDVGLYLFSAIFAGVTAATSTLAPHRAWGAVAAAGYAGASLLAGIQWATRSTGVRGRAALAVATFGAVALLPLVWQSIDRAVGRTDRAQEEVTVIEHGAGRLLDTGTPYLGRDAIAALPPDERLLGYLPYQPGMAVFGLPRAAAGTAAWTDARVWFAAVTVAALAGAVVLLARARTPGPPLVRAIQAATVVPVCALTLATGGDDLPVLALCLLGFALAATHRWGLAGLAVGAAAVMKLFAWPVAVVLGTTAAVARQGWWYAAGAVGIPVVTAVPALLVDPGALVENVLAYPFGRGLVTTPAASPLPGQLLATSVPGGRYLVYALLASTGVAIAIALVRRPPRTAADAALWSGLGLLALTLLLPATRFGYLLYPIALLVWSVGLRSSTVESESVATA